MIRYYNGDYGFPAGNVDGLSRNPELIAGSPSFDINKAGGALGGRSGEQLKRLYEGGTQQNQQLNEELKRRGIMPGAGPQLPLAMGGFQGGVPMGNAAFFPGGQLPQGFIGKTVV
jgi:hypothetical protein